MAGGVRVRPLSKRTLPGAGSTPRLGNLFVPFGPASC